MSAWHSQRVTINKEVWYDTKEYVDDYLQVIRSRDNIKMTYLHKSTQLIYRKYLINHMKTVATDRKLTHSTLHLSVYLLDIFMDRHTVMPDILLLVSNVCILLAAKVEEHHMNIPKIAELNSIVRNMYSVNDYKLLEVILLNYFEWYVMYPTAAYYTHYFMQAVIDNDDVQIIENMEWNLREIYIELNAMLKIYLDRVLEDVHYMQCYEPSKLAAAAISAARLRVQLPAWNIQLTSFTEYVEEDIRIIREFLLQSKPLICMYCHNRKDLE